MASAGVVRISICERFDFIEPLRQACLFEVTPDLLLVNAGDLKQELDVAISFSVRAGSLFIACTFMAAMCSALGASISTLRPRIARLPCALEARAEERSGTDAEGDGDIQFLLQ